MASAESRGYFDEVTEAAESLRGHGFAGADVAIVLGSGLGAFADGMADRVAIDYGDIPHWPASNVIGHAGQLVRGVVGGHRVLALSGRVHFYEGHDLRTVTFAVRVLGRLGVKTLILTNAAGGINTSFSQGALMVIDDHLNFLGTNPLMGPNEDRFGVRFPDMSEVYSRRLRATADDAARAAAAPSAPLARTPLVCPQCPKPSSRDRWASRCWASRASATWRRACCHSRSITKRSWRRRDGCEGSSSRCWRASLSDSEALVEAARRARERAVADYSGFKVGAAIETTDGQIVTGCNIENATYGLTICAERVAIFKALSEGHRSFSRLAVVADTEEPTPPCGACRQIIWEFAGDIEIILVNLHAVTARHAMRTLFPHAFDRRFLK